MDTFPFGIIRCTYEKYPKVTYINRHMLDMLEASEENSNWREFAEENIFFLIPFEERDTFRMYLDEADKTSEPINLEHDMVKATGETENFLGWVIRDRLPDGTCEYAFMYIPVSAHHNLKRKRRENSYFSALKSAYNCIFEINLNLGTVECIHGRETSQIGSTYDICMTIDSAKEYWIGNYILEEDREMAVDYFNRISNMSIIRAAHRPLQAELGLRLDNGEIIHYIAVAVELNSSSVLLCCRDITNVKYMPIHNEMPHPQSKVFIRTFDYFDVFVNGEPVLFSGDKEKELMAILVNYRGGNVTSSNAITLLWEDEGATEKVKGRYRKLAMGLNNTLKKYGIEDIIVSSRGTRHLDTDAVVCDLFEALEGNETYRKMFHGVYMQEYSWAEETLGLLIQLL